MKWKEDFVDFKEDFNFCPQNKLKGILQTAILVKFFKYLYFWVEGFDDIKQNKEHGAIEDF